MYHILCRHVCESHALIELSCGSHHCSINIIKWASHESDHPISIRKSLLVINRPFIISTLLFVEKDIEEIFQQIYGKPQSNKLSNKGYPKVHIKTVRSSTILSTMQLQISIIELWISVMQWWICTIIKNIHNSQQLWTSIIPLWIFVNVLWISIILSEIYI